QARRTQDVAVREGPFVAFREAPTAPRPLRAPHPPVWVGGASEGALRRAVLHGDAWHPIRVRVDWLRDAGLPKLREIAQKEDRRMPPLCPRIKLQLTEAPLPEDTRTAGPGSPDEVRGDLRAVEMLGAPYVLLDTYLDDPEATRSHEPAWRLLRTVAERLVDLGRQAIR